MILVEIRALLYIMSLGTVNKLNHLLMNGNPGGLYFSAQLKENGYSDQLIKEYRSIFNFIVEYKLA